MEQSKVFNITCYNKETYLDECEEEKEITMYYYTVTHLITKLEFNFTYINTCLNTYIKLLHINEPDYRRGTKTNYINKLITPDFFNENDLTDMKIKEAYNYLLNNRHLVL